MEFLRYMSLNYLYLFSSATTSSCQQVTTFIHRSTIISGHYALRLLCLPSSVVLNVTPSPYKQWFLDIILSSGIPRLLLTAPSPKVNKVTLVLEILSYPCGKSRFVTLRAVGKIFRLCSQSTGLFYQLFHL